MIYRKVMIIGEKVSYFKVAYIRDIFITIINFLKNIVGCFRDKSWFLCLRGNISFFLVTAVHFLYEIQYVEEEETVLETELKWVIFF